ncbi:MAG: hypothetical protein RL536_70 [Candidatus Parcubacteria bacterium]|jgi:Tfp pilus assembly protein PilV
MKHLFKKNNKVNVATSSRLAKFSKTGGFTIVETLIAITVLMIAVAGPLVVASKGLTSALISKDQMIASYLAQETMETLKNIRDNTLQDTISQYGSNPVAFAAHWLDGTGYQAGSRCDVSNQGCDINGVDVELVTVPSCIPANCGIPLFYNDSNGYTHSSTGGARPTVFSRHFYFDNAVTNNNKPEITAHVVVDWQEGRVPYQIELTSQMVAVSK